MAINRFLVVAAGFVLLSAGYFVWSVEAADCEGVTGGSCTVWGAAEPLAEGVCCVQSVDHVYKSCHGVEVRSVTKGAFQCGRQQTIILEACSGTNLPANCGGAKEAEDGCTSKFCES